MPRPRRALAIESCVALLYVLVAATCRAREGEGTPDLRGLPRSDRQFWRRVSDPTVEKAARVRVLVERLIAKARVAQDEPQVAKRLYASVGAIVELSGVEPRKSGELGFLVGHALVGSEEHDDARARSWLESALRQCPTSPLAFMAWMDLAQLHARGGNLVEVLDALNNAAAQASSPAELAEVHHARAVAYERAVDLEHARIEYVAWLQLGGDENSMAQAGWHLAVILDLQGEHEAALHKIDEAEARAYDRGPSDLVAIDSPSTRWSGNALAIYAQGIKYRWLAARRGVPTAAESNAKALAAFEAVAQLRDTDHWGATKWHLRELKRALQTRRHLEK